jgi:hypothetical protein
MGLLNSIPTPTLNFQPALHKTPEELLSHMKALGITFDRGSEATAKASYIDQFGDVQIAPANYPRINFDPVTGINKGLLIEELRTYLFATSETFTSFSPVNASIGSPSVNSPISGVDWKSLVEDSTTNAHYYPATGLCTSGNKYSVSIFMKSAGRNFVTLWFSSLSTTYSARFNLSSGSVAFEGSNITASIKKMGVNGYLCKIQTNIALSGNSALTLYMHDSDTSTTSYTGNGSSGIYFQGYNISEGAVPSSYVKTSGTSVNRSSDDGVLSGASFLKDYNENEGSFLCDFNIPFINTANNQYLFSADNGSAAEMLRAYINASGDLIISVVSSSSESVSLNMGAITAETDYSVSITYDSNGISASLNGGAISTDASISLPSPDAFGIGRKTYEDTEMLNGTIGRCLIFNQRVSDDLLKSFSRL